MCRVEVSVCRVEWVCRVEVSVCMVEWVCRVEFHKCGGVKRPASQVKYSCYKPSPPPIQGLTLPPHYGVHHTTHSIWWPWIGWTGEETPE